MHTHKFISPRAKGDTSSPDWIQALPWWWRQPPALKPRAPAPSWQVVLPALRPPAWPLVIVALVALGLLFAFHQVVAQVVVQADQQRAATVAQQEIVWNCKLLREPRERDGCLAQISAAYHLKAPRGQQVPAVTAVADAGSAGRRYDAAAQALMAVAEE